MEGCQHLRTTAGAGTGDLDLVVTSDPVSLPGITYVPLFGYEAMLAVDNHHTLCENPYLEPTDIVGETLITYPIE